MQDSGGILATPTRRRTARPSSRAELAQSYPLSVVIPARNSRDTLRRCLAALAGNDLTGVEVTVVDDASSDGTGSVAQEWTEGARVGLISLESRSGPAGARNKGLERAAHPHVLFLDCDVLLPARSIEWIRETLDLYSHRPEVAGVLGIYAQEIPHRDFLSNYKNLYTRHLYLATDPLSPYIHTPVFCVQKDLLRSHGGFNASRETGEDFQLGVVLGSRGYRFVIDRRINAVHLKEYSFSGAMRENARRIQDLTRLDLSREERAFSLRAHRWSRILSLAIPGPSLAIGLLALRQPLYLIGLLLLLSLFGLANLRFLQLCRRSRGWVFALQSAGFLFFEMLAAEYLTLRAYVRKWISEPRT